MSLALINSTCEAVKGKETLQDCMKKVKKEKTKCIKDNKKLDKKKQELKDCENIAQLGSEMCRAQHPITHSTYEHRRSMQVPQEQATSSNKENERVAIASTSTAPFIDQHDQWTTDDQNNLERYNIDQEGFLDQIKDLKQCKNKIHELAKNTSTNLGSANSQPELFRLLNKLCKTSFGTSATSSMAPSTSSSSSSFQTPSVFGSAHISTPSTDNSPRTPDHTFISPPRPYEALNPGLVRMESHEKAPSNHNEIYSQENNFDSDHGHTGIDDSDDGAPPPPPDESYPGNEEAQF